MLFSFRRAALAAAFSLIAAAQTPRDIPAALQPFLDNHTLAGAVTLVATPEKILDVQAVGYADIAAKKPMTRDSLFWIASMSKPITTTAFMMLVDEGKVKLDDPVEKYLPEFKDQWLAVESDKDHRLLKPVRAITVREILSHTSGLPFSTGLEKPTLDVFPLEARVRGYAMTPLEFAPGTKYQYSNAGINTAGRIIEVVSGMSYENFLDTRLFGPARHEGHHLLAGRRATLARRQELPVEQADRRVGGAQHHATALPA
jgi:CubicO group peptidase (beta-lactamase class C family)